MKCQTRPGGFTLVELLVVISIICVLVALTMPAINGAREQGRKTQCAQNLSQLAKACLAFEGAFQHLPPGGWGAAWAGDPNRAPGSDQPGGWQFAILPYLDKGDLHDLGKGEPKTSRMPQGMIQSQTPLQFLLCPTRHGQLEAFPRNNPLTPFINITDTLPRSCGKSDYAANSGSNYSGITPYTAGQPGTTGATGSAPPDGIYPIKVDWTQVPGTMVCTSLATRDNGVISRASATPLGKIIDGDAFTYLIGERNLNVKAYHTSTNTDNEQGWDVGYSYDTNRWTGTGQITPTASATPFPPTQDRAGVGNPSVNFGSAHASGFNMAFCDGRVSSINYDIDPVTHMQLGNIADGQPTQLDKVWGGK